MSLEGTVQICRMALVHLVLGGSLLPQVPSVDTARQRSVLTGNEPFGITGELAFRISAVQAGSAAAKSGLRVNDLILAVEGQKLADFEQVRRTILDPIPQPGKKVELIIGRLRSGSGELGITKVIVETR